MEVSTSVLNIDEANVLKTMYNLEVARTDYFHIDVMDGRFVENDTSEKMRIYCEYLNQITTVPIDVHLMVKNIKEYIDSYLVFNPNIITFHYEACKDIEEVEKYIKYIKENDCKVGLSIKPQTDIKDIEKLLPEINLLLIMSVEPGKGGQKFIEDTLNKIKEAERIIEELGISTQIEVDGGINLENIGKIKEAGATIAVVGTTIINSEDYKHTINELKK